MDEFCRLVEEKKGKPWAEVRKAFAFNGKVIKPALAEALDISEEDANNWFNDKSATELSVSQLVDDINAYVSTKPANFRLLFMVDEAGQYVGTDTDMLLNLQSLEKSGWSVPDRKLLMRSSRYAQMNSLGSRLVSKLV